MVAQILGFAIVLEAGKQLLKFLQALVGEQLRGFAQTLQDIQRIALGVRRFIVAHGRAPLCRHGIAQTRGSRNGIDSASSVLRRSSSGIDSASVRLWEQSGRTPSWPSG